MAIMLAAVAAVPIRTVGKVLMLYSAGTVVSVRVRLNLMFSFGRTVVSDCDCTVSFFNVSTSTESFFKVSTCAFVCIIKKGKRTEIRCFFGEKKEWIVFMVLWLFFES